GLDIPVSIAVDVEVGDPSPDVGEKLCRGKPTAVDRQSETAVAECRLLKQQVQVKSLGRKSSFVLSAVPEIQLRRGMECAGGGFQFAIQLEVMVKATDGPPIGYLTQSV